MVRHSLALVEIDVRATIGQVDPKELGNGV